MSPAPPVIRTLVVRRLRDTQRAAHGRRFLGCNHVVHSCTGDLPRQVRLELSVGLSGADP